MVKLKKNSKILLLLVAIISLFGFSMIFASDEPGKITISKSATKIYDDAGDDNLKKGRNAKVTLTVNGNPYTTSQTSMSKLDIILVLDNSGSMAWGSRGKNDTSTPSRIASLKSTADEFIDTMLDKDGNVQIGLVTFSKDVNTSVSFSNYSKKGDLTTAINGMKAYGGTNLQAGIEQAHDLLGGGRNDAKKMVIILTDGIPTFFNYTYYDYLVICGTGDSDNPIPFCSNMRPSDAAKKELDDLKKDYSTADIYTITFGEEEEAASKLEKINPVETTENHTYKNEKALDANQLKKLFENISQCLKNVLATNGVVTDTIPSDFSLTDTAKKDLESKGVEVTENEDGTTTLKWNIGDISAKNELSLTYEVRAKDEYHGSMYTNTKAVLTAEASEDNPFYENKDLSLEFEEPSVEIPAITKDDHYKDNSSYKGYSGGTINGTSILNNDLNKNIERESKEDVSVTDKIVIVENDNVKKIADNKYKIYKDSSLQGTLTINEDGTFTFNSSVDTIGEVSFDYYIESDITNPHETKDVESNTSTVTLLINERQKMSINGKKIWEDDNNNDGLRPESVNVNLYADNEVIKTIDVTKSSDWKYSFNDLYVYRVGHENEESEKIVYRVAETQSYNGYSSSVDGYNITNKHEIEKTEVSGTKTWEDNNNQDGKRPESIKVNLLADGKVVDFKEVSAKDKWTYKFENLNVYKNGQKIKYTINEDTVEGYTTEINGYNITNKHEVEKTEVSGTKTWEDNNNQDGKRPESIKVNLLADGKVVDSKEVSAKDQWNYKFENLNVYNNGQKIKYIISEDTVEGYTTEINGYNITNKHEVEKAEVSGTKTWEDNNNQDGKRPESIKVNLLADGKVVDSKEVSAKDQWNYKFENLNVYNNGQKIKYIISEDTVEGYTTEINGYNITNKHEVEKAEVSGTKTWEDNNNQDGKRPESIKVNLLADGKVVDFKEVSAKDKWTYKFENLNVYKNGQKIKYTISEDSIEGYTTKINDYNITNKHEVEKTEVSGTKTWEDNNNQDGKRPESIKVNLLADGKVVDSKEVSAKDQWNYKFENLNVYNNGQKIKYIISEDTVEGYTTEINGYNITNKHEVEKAEVSGTKTWEDNNNQDGKRPESIKVNLLADGKVVDSKEVSAKDQWTYKFENLNVYNNGQKIKYTISEDTVEGYTTEISGYDITNTHTPQTIDINGKKIWNDSNNQDGKRPSSVTIQLYADGEKVEGQTATISGEGNNWDYSFKNLPMYKAGEIGHEIKYSVQEVNVDSNYSVQYDKENKFNIINTHDNIKTEVSGTKTWDDNNNQDGKRPEKITVRLYANGNEKESQEVKPGSDGKWNYSFTGLDKYSEGKEITYTVSEDNVEGYKTEISGNNITNIHNPEKISITGTKTWNDNNNQDGIRPDSITINLLANGEKVSSTIANSESNWNYSFTNLDKYNQGTEIKYALEEVSVDGYTSEITDFNITNTHTPETVSYILQKAWSDQDNNDGIRPEYIIVHLYADGYEKLSQKVIAASGWTYTFENLPKYNNGKLINYTFTEEIVKGYNSSIVINDNANNNQSTDRDKIIDNNQNDSNKSENTKNVTITNTHENEKNNITITKKWNDSDNIYNKRPDSIKVTIVGKVNGQIIVQKDIEITKNMNWLYITKDLDKYYKGQEIKYEIIEDEVGDYTTTYDGYSIINTYIKPAIGETSGEITPPNTGVETSSNSSLLVMLLMLVSLVKFILIRD